MGLSFRNRFAFATIADLCRTAPRKYNELMLSNQPNLNGAPRFCNRTNASCAGNNFPSSPRCSRRSSLRTQARMIRLHDDSKRIRFAVAEKAVWSFRFESIESDSNIRRSTERIGPEPNLEFIRLPANAPGGSSTIILLWIPSAISAVHSSSSAASSCSSVLFSTSVENFRSVWENFPATSFTAASTPRFIFPSSLASSSASAFLSFSGSFPTSAVNRLQISARNFAFLIYSSRVQLRKRTV
jgi:hypothetical protein